MHGLKAVLNARHRPVHLPRLLHQRRLPYYFHNRLSPHNLWPLYIHHRDFACVIYLGTDIGMSLIQNICRFQAEFGHVRLLCCNVLFQDLELGKDLHYDVGDPRIPLVTPLSRTRVFYVTEVNLAEQDANVPTDLIVGVIQVGPEDVLQPVVQLGDPPPLLLHHGQQDDYAGGCCKKNPPSSKSVTQYNILS